MFKFVETQDGSPSLRIEESEGQESESMHSLRGAFSETVYIYGTAIETCLREEFEPRIFSLGLGLGYVEVLSAALILRDAPEKKHIAGGESFELVPQLRDWFRAWVHGEEEKVPQDFARVYDDILARTATQAGINGKEIRAYLSDLLKEGRWTLSGPLAKDTKIEGTFGCICFDAFSSKTSPDLWTEEFLNDFLSRVTAPGCVLSTYACTGALKRSLRANGFDLSIREGFASKRDSTFAVRKFGA